MLIKKMYRIVCFSQTVAEISRFEEFFMSSLTRLFQNGQVELAFHPRPQDMLGILYLDDRQI